MSEETTTYQSKGAQYFFAALDEAGGDIDSNIEIGGVAWRRRRWRSWDEIARTDGLLSITIAVNNGNNSRGSLRAYLHLTPTYFMGAGAYDCGSLDEALERAKNIRYTTREVGGLIWYSTNQNFFESVIGEGDVGSIYRFDDGRYSITRKITHEGNSYELGYRRNGYYRLGEDGYLERVEASEIEDFETAARLCAALFDGLSWTRAQLQGGQGGC